MIYYNDWSCFMFKEWCYKDDLYLRSDIRVTGYMFEYCDKYAKKLYNFDKLTVKVFVEKFMNSKTREGMDIGWPTYFGQAALDTFEDYVNDELDGNITILSSGVNDYNSFHDGELLWIGRMYAYIHYRTKFSSKDLYKKLPLDIMRHQYVTGHQVSRSIAYENLIGYIYE